MDEESDILTAPTAHDSAATQRSLVEPGDFFPDQGVRPYELHSTPVPEKDVKAYAVGTAEGNSAYATLAKAAQELCIFHRGNIAAAQAEIRDSRP